MKNPYSLLYSIVYHQNNWFSLHKDVVVRDDKPQSFFVIRKDDAVFIAAINKQNQIRLVRLFRYATSSWSLEIPAGGSDGQDLFVAANRELKEETGLVATNIKKIAEFKIAPGITDNIAHLFLATDLEQTDEDEQEEEGIVETVDISLDHIDYWISSGDISDGPTIACLYLLKIYIEENDMSKNRVKILKTARGILREQFKKLKQFHFWRPRSQKLDKNKKAIENKNKCRRKVDE